MRLLKKVITSISLCLLATLPGQAHTPDHQHIGTLDPSLLDASLSEATKYLSQYLRINTTVPPGNEELGAKYLADIFLKNGIEATLFKTAPNRSCVYAKLPGTGKKPPIVLLNHIDVVPAQAADWKHPPFAGEIHENEVWGRGALDIKGMAICELQTMLMLKRSHAPLNRDIIFLATPDEEVGGEYGAKWFVKNHQKLLNNAKFLINEGFHIDATADGRSRYWGIDVAEKNVLWLKITAHGQAGHASMPIGDSATNRLIKALGNIVNIPARVMILPAVQEYFKEISPSASLELQAAYKDIAKATQDSKTLGLLLTDKLKSSMLMNTISITVLNGGYKTNVIPATCYAELDCRLLPGVKHKDFVRDLANIIDDPQIDISVLEWEHTEASPFDTELVNCIKATARQESPNTPVVPVIVPWFTDSHWFRELGINCYGFIPFQIDEEHLSTMHGKDERLPLNSFHNGIQRLYKILEAMSVDAH